MQAKVLRNPRLDALDRERFQAMLASESWKLFRDRVVVELERNRATCERADSKLELRRSQGAVKALQTVLLVPERLMEEMKSKEK